MKFILFLRKLVEAALHQNKRANRIKEAVETRKRAPKMGVRRREPWGDGDKKFQGKTREEPLPGEQDGEDPT